MHSYLPKRAVMGVDLLLIEDQHAAALVLIASPGLPCEKLPVRFDKLLMSGPLRWCNPARVGPGALYHGNGGVVAMPLDPPSSYVYPSC